MNKFACLLTALVVALSSTAAAEEPVTFDVYMGPGAMICDLPESVETSLERGVMMPDCGILQLRPGTGVETTVTVFGYYDGKPLVMFEFHRSVGNVPPVQYGWWAGEIPEDVPKGVAL